MALQEEIESKAKQIHTDGYSLSIGELMSLYREGEIDIHPDFQRFFRWTSLQKSKLIESILLGIPIPPIFVSQRNDGIWDVIDGLQRLSTIFEFTGILRDSNNEIKPPSSLLGTDYLPSLQGKFWQKDDDPGNSFDQVQRLVIKRAKLGVQIIKKESDSDTKYELFQRLNTGGTALTEQEIRNCLLIMINKNFYQWLSDLSKTPDFQNTLPFTEKAIEEQYDTELALRYFVYKSVTLQEISGIRDIGKIVTDKMIEFATNADFNFDAESENFLKCFRLLNLAFGEDVFKKWDERQGKFSGAFSIAAFEVIATGLAANLQFYDDTPHSIDILKDKIKAISSNAIFNEHSGSGKRASTRLIHFIPLGNQIFSYEDQNS